MTEALGVDGPRTTRAPRRIPRADELGPLMRCYGYRFTRTGSVAGAERSRSPEDVAAAAGLGWPVDTTERLGPAEIVTRAVAAAADLDEDAVLGAFVAGLGSAPRGRQTAVSYGWARFLDGAPAGPDGLPDCGLGPAHGTVHEIDVTERLLRLALGWAWNELPAHYLPDLEAASAEGLPVPTADDRERLRALLDLVAAAPAGTTPGQLEKSVARAKVVPGTDKYQRYGILIGLAEIGVLPSRVLAPSWDRFVPAAERTAAFAGGRSDLTPPLSGWRGGLDRTRAERLREL